MNLKTIIKTFSLVLCCFILGACGSTKKDSVNPAGMSKWQYLDLTALIYCSLAEKRSEAGIKIEDEMLALAKKKGIQSDNYPDLNKKYQVAKEQYKSKFNILFLMVKVKQQCPKAPNIFGGG